MRSAFDGVGQVIYPLADAAWRPDPQLRAAVSEGTVRGNP